MDARLRELPDKYYNTEILFSDGLSGISIWYMGSRTPSGRQLKQWNMTLDEALKEDMLCDDHYETAEAYSIATYIIRHLNTYLPYQSKEKQAGPMNAIEKFNALITEASGDVIPDDSLTDAERLVKGAVMCAGWLCRLCDGWPAVKTEIERLQWYEERSQQDWHYCKDNRILYYPQALCSSCEPTSENRTFDPRKEIIRLRAQLERAETLLRETNRCIAAGFPTNTAERIDAYCHETKKANP